MDEPKSPNGHDSQGWFVNLLGWVSFLGLFVTGLIGLLGAWPQERREVNLAGAAYLLVGGLAFGSVLLLVLILRRGPKI